MSFSVMWRLSPFPRRAVQCACVAVVIVATELLAATASPVLAQSWLQSLFGIGAPSAPTAVPPSRMPLRSTPAPYGAFGGSLPYGYDEPAPSQGQTYRTLCVRTCDGYYWPVSNSVTRSQLYRDHRVCQSNCGGVGKLFYYPTSGGSVDTMTDLSGRVYSQLPTAFLYRKTLVSGCACKPEPWSETELMRHQQYAMVEAAQRPARRAPEATVVAGANVTSDAQPEIAVASRPDKVESPRFEAERMAEPETRSRSSKKKGGRHEAQERGGAQQAVARSQQPRPKTVKVAAKAPAQAKSKPFSLSIF